ncbi:MAG TPA: sulfocyanin-like copper-binding protein [Gemmatimonadales bacterium]|nr:sulfocyanin-like copper-binding protein [Gemmatimonadales bacterium]
MRISCPGRTPALFVTGLLAGILAAGCSRDPERTPVLQSSASATPVVNTDTAVLKTDTSIAQPSRSKASPPTETTTPKRVSTSPASPAPSTAPASANQDKWLKYDPATNTVTFELIAGPFTFNGFRDGQATLTLPPKANVIMNFVNKDGTPHSAIIISGDGPIPNSAIDPAIPRAYTNKVLEGLPQEGSDVMRFPVPESGRYRIFCGVPGHGPAGMWLWMKVDPAAKAPSFGPTKA